jgi:hypothetical protein
MLTELNLVVKYKPSMLAELSLVVKYNARQSLNDRGDRPTVSEKMYTFGNFINETVFTSTLEKSWCVPR